MVQVPRRSSAASQSAPTCEQGTVHHSTPTACLLAKRWGKITYLSTVAVYSEPSRERCIHCEHGNSSISRCQPLSRGSPQCFIPPRWLILIWRLCFDFPRPCGSGALPITQCSGSGLQHTFKMRRRCHVPFEEGLGIVRAMLVGRSSITNTLKSSAAYGYPKKHSASASRLRR